MPVFISAGIVAGQGADTAVAAAIMHIRLSAHRTSYRWPHQAVGGFTTNVLMLARQDELTTHDIAAGLDFVMSSSQPVHMVAVSLCTLCTSAQCGNPSQVQRTWEAWMNCL